MATTSGGWRLVQVRIDSKLKLKIWLETPGTAVILLFFHRVPDTFRTAEDTDMHLDRDRALSCPSSNTNGVAAVTRPRTLGTLCRD